MHTYGARTRVPSKVYVLPSHVKGLFFLADRLHAGERLPSHLTSFFSLSNLDLDAPEMGFSMLDLGAKRL